MGIQAVKLYIKMLLIIISVVILLILTIIPRLNFVSTGEHSFMQFVAVFIPVLLFINLFMLLLFTVRFKIWLLIPLLTFIINYQLLGAFFGFNFFNSEEPKSITIKVLTYNVNYFSFQNETINVTEVARLAYLHNIDIITFQEFETNSYFNEKEIIDEFDFLPYTTSDFTGFKQTGLVIFSKYPIIRSSSILFDKTNNGCIWADILFKGDTIRVINNHLQTTGVTKNLRKGFSSLYFSAKDNYKERAKQVNTIRRFIDTTFYPLLVCGDFNDTPVSYTYKKMAGYDLFDSFTEAGRGPGGTYLSKLFMNRIDYVLHSRDFHCKSFTTLSVNLSDHKPVIVEMEYQN